MPTGTALSIITRSLREAGVLGDSAVPQNSQGPNGLLTLNGMIDSWTIDQRYIYCRNIATYALTSGTQSYDIGPTAAAPFAVTRPTKIINANIVLSSGGHMPIAIFDDDQRMGVFYPDQTASMPLALNYKRSFPNGNIWLWFKPASGYSLEIETDNLLSEFATLATSYVFPPGYYEAIVYSLAERFCTPGWGRSIDPSISKLAADARAKIESLNLDPPPLQSCNPAAFGISRGGNSHGITVANDIRSGRRFYRG